MSDRSNVMPAANRDERPPFVENRHGLTDEALELLYAVFEAGRQCGYAVGHHDGSFDEGYRGDPDGYFERRWGEDGLGEEWASAFLKLVPAPLLGVSQ